MAVIKTELIPIRTDGDVVEVRSKARALVVEAGFSLVDQTKFVTAASELARNTLEHGGGGTALLESLNEGMRRGVRLTFEDRGKGIADIELAMKDGYSTGNGLGLGLSGSKRLVNEFSIDSKPGEGTRIVIAKWR